ncbi:MAG TPA: extracellular solute-binding protein [Candidatus Limnocylindrales bacterium]|nr:extracellular solute-binding protein [Candidatus Limnocylindrales bacterium]
MTELSSHRRPYLGLVHLAALALVASACAPGATPAPSAAPSPSAAASEAPAASPAGGGYEQWQPPQDLLAGATSEGMLTTIALPHDWCNYGESIETFKQRTGLQVNELDPNAGSGDELEAIRANKDNPGPQAPDVIDVGLSFGPLAKEEGLLQPYKVATWDTIPDGAKDPEGYWWGDYYGVLSFEVNTAVVQNVPQDWVDLLKPEYKGQVALAGDPRTSNQAIQTVYAAALANGGSLDNAEPGLQFFKQLNEAGNLVPIIATAATVAAGETPITIRWTYNALSNRDQTAASGGPAIEVVVPKSGRFGGVYVQGISAYAPHPNAAKLWQEFLFSDEGQNIWLKGYCHPIRYENLVAENKVPQEQLAKLPDVTGAVFPSLEQLNAATKLITENWDSVVGANIQ